MFSPIVGRIEVTDIHSVQSPELPPPIAYTMRQPSTDDQLREPSSQARFSHGLSTRVLHLAADDAFQQADDFAVLKKVCATRRQ